MNLKYVAVFCSAPLLVVATESAHGQTEVRNDGFATGQMAGFQLGFVADEEGAATLVPEGAGPHSIEKVTLLFGGATTTETITLNIYDDSAMNATPGARLFTGEYNIVGANDALSEIDLSADNIVAPGPFRVSVEFQHAGAPSIARDNDGVSTPGRNWIEVQGGTWLDAATLGVNGDWIIRATVAGGGGSPDAGPNNPDAGTGQACALNSDCPNGSYCSETNECAVDCRLEIDCAAGEECGPIGQCVVSEGSDGGCGCQVGGSDVPTGVLLLVALAIALGLPLRRQGRIARRQ